MRRRGQRGGDRRPQAQPRPPAGPDRSAMWQVRGWRPDERPPVNGTAVPSPHLGHCRCGAPAVGACAEGCGRPTCGPHLLPGSNLARGGPYRSEREHTAYLHAFASAGGPRCQWCREEAGVAAIAALPPVPDLPTDAREALCLLARRGHDYAAGAWDDTVAGHGGVTELLRRLAPEALGRAPVQSFEGRRRPALLVGTPVGQPGAQGCLEVIDGAGSVWLVRPVAGGMASRGRRAWSWEPAGGPCQEALLRWLVGRLAAATDA